MLADFQRMPAGIEDSYNKMSLSSPGGGYREGGKAAVGVLLESRG